VFVICKIIFLWRQIDCGIVTSSFIVQLFEVYRIDTLFWHFCGCQNLESNHTLYFLRLWSNTFWRFQIYERRIKWLNLNSKFLHRCYQESFFCTFLGEFQEEKGMQWKYKKNNLSKNHLIIREIWFVDFVCISILNKNQFDKRPHFYKGTDYCHICIRIESYAFVE